MAARLALNERCKIAVWMETHQSVITVQRNFRNYFHKDPPSRPTIYAIHHKFLTTGSVVDIKSTGRHRDIRNVENVVRVLEAFTENPATSIRRVSAETDLSYGSIQRILRKDLKMFPYHVQLLQQLYPHDFDVREEMCSNLLRRFTNDPMFIDCILFSDESTFHVSGRVHRHNCRIWGLERPIPERQHERDSPKVNVWCGMTTNGIVGPFFFENRGRTVNITADNYLEMLRMQILPALVNHPQKERLIFQQDGAPPHFGIHVREFLNVEFPNRWIGRRGSLMEWAPRSPDLTPLDFFLWGYVKTKVYATKPANTLELKQRIVHEIANIDQDVLFNVFNHAIHRFQKCVQLHGHHVEV